MSLELKHTSPYLPFGVNFISSMDDSDDTIELNKIWTLDGINKLFGDYCLLTKENNDAYDIKTCKLLLRPLSDLTKEIEVDGEKFVPLIKLFMIARGAYDIPVKHYSIMSSEWIKIEMLGYRDYHLRLVSTEGDIRLDKGYLFEMFSTNLRCDDKKQELVQNHNILFQKLYEWHFDLHVLIEKGLAVDINTLNQDK